MGPRARGQGEEAARHQSQDLPQRTSRAKSTDEEDHQNARGETQQKEERGESERRRGSGLSTRQGGTVASQSSLQHDQAKAQRKGRQMGRAFAQSESRERSRSLPRRPHRQIEAESVEENGHQSHLRRRRLYEETAEVRAIHPTDGASVQKGPRHASRVASYLPTAYHRREKEP